MRNQIIITFGREYGSGGHIIAKKLADEMGISYYDKKKLVEGTARLSGYDRSMVKKFDEKPAGFPFSGRIGSFDDSPENNVAMKTFEYIRHIAESGESCVIVGRCAESVLRDNPNVVKVFVTGRREDKIDRIAHIRKLSKKEAEEECKEMDHFRRAYHNYYSENRWGDSRAYDIVINSSCLGITGSMEVVLKLCEAFRDQE